eukprot:COSAG02_NODE_9087_length_2336_cov_1.527939_1_plen_321_part_10
MCFCAQLKKNVIAAYTAETYFGGHGHSVLNTKLRNLQECPPLTPAAQLLHHAVSELAASPEYGHDGVAYRAMRLPPELVGKYKVHQDSKLNLFSWPGFTSCTRDAETCLGFVDDWDLNVVFAIRSGGCRLRPMRIEEWSQHPEELEVLYDLGQQFEILEVDRTTRGGAARLLGLEAAEAGGSNEHEVVVISVKAVDRFNDLVLDIFKDGGSIAEALHVCLLRLDRERRIYGERSEQAAAALACIATVYDSQGDYARSLEYNEKALAIKLQALGPDHPEVGTTYSNMAMVYDNQGDYARSLEYNEKALAIDLQALGPDHPSV